MAGTILKVGIKYILRRNSTRGETTTYLSSSTRKMKTNGLSLRLPCAASTHGAGPSSSVGCCVVVVCRPHHLSPPPSSSSIPLSPVHCLIVIFVCRSCRVVRRLPPAARRPQSMRRPPSAVCATAPHRRRRRDPLLARLLLFDCCVVRCWSSVISRCVVPHSAAAEACATPSPTLKVDC